MDGTFSPMHSRVHQDVHLHRPMRPPRQRLLVALLVLFHVVLLLAYTLPRHWVPNELRTVALRYVRPVFHQQWLLFAPDPPLCACQVQVGLSAGKWRPVVPPDFHFLKERMARPLADHVQQQVLAGDTVLIPVLSATLRTLVRDIGREVPDLRFRLVEQCVEDPARPEVRVERITPLQLSPP